MSYVYPFVKKPISSQYGTNLQLCFTLEVGVQPFRLQSFIRQTKQSKFETGHDNIYHFGQFSGASVRGDAP
jgi:hypothetical protein